MQDFVTEVRRLKQTGYTPWKDNEIKRKNCMYININ